MTRRAVSDRINEAQIERLLFHMPACAERARTEWLKRFAADMAKRRHWRNWRPSGKQIDIMQGMVADLFPARAGSGEVIES